MRSPWASAEIERVEGDSRVLQRDELIVEEPLEIRVAGDPIAITMRTPGHDRELVLGFLWAEGILRSLDDVGSIVHCGRPGDPGFGNIVDVVPAGGAVIDADRELVAARRGTLTTSACGVCGRRSIDDLLARCEVPTPPMRVIPRAVIARAAREMRGHQSLFARTGGCHAASLWTLAGEHVVTYEDVGRHNAVDAVVGSQLLARRLPLRDRLLVVSGRASFEIVQKAIAAGISAVASVSAPSSLAVELARRAELVLIGFVRGDSLAIYSGAAHVG